MAVLGAGALGVGALGVGVLGAEVLGAGCTLKVTPDDAGTDAGPQSVGDQCKAIFTELCQQAVGGYTGFTLDTCVTSNVTACCTGSECDATSQSPASAVDACKAALDGEDCYAISISTTPATCSGVPKKP